MLIVCCMKIDIILPYSCILTRAGNRSGSPNGFFKVLEKCTKNLIGHSRLAFNNHESNIDC